MPVRDLSIDQLIRAERGANGRRIWKPVLGWTGLIGGAIFASSLAGWLLFRDLADPVLAFMFAFGGAGMLYLTVADLVPAAARHHFQQSATLACAAGFLVILMLSSLI
jgi:ZIP family zinc transporter